MYCTPLSFFFMKKPHFRETLDGLIEKASSNEDFTFECALCALCYFKHIDVESDDHCSYFENKTLDGGRTL